jgi:hypothetical protein
MGCIYSLTFSNGKKYIGMTSEALYRRISIHRRDAKHKDLLIYRAWRKYGEPEVKTLAYLEKHMLRETERKAIAAFNTMVPNGYNLVAGGEGGGVGPETSLKMSLARRGKPKSESFIRKLSLRMQGNSYMLGKKQSAEHVLKRIKSGWNHTPEALAKMSALKKARGPMSQEVKDRIAETMRKVRAEREWSTRRKG